MRYSQNKLYYLFTYSILFISFITLNPANTVKQTDNDEFFIENEHIFDNEKNLEKKDVHIEENVTAQNDLIEENVTAQNDLIEENKTFLK